MVSKVCCTVYKFEIYLQHYSNLIRNIDNIEIILPMEIILITNFQICRWRPSNGIHFCIKHVDEKVCLFPVYASQEDGKHVIHDYVM